MSSAKDDWQTPEVVLDAVRRFRLIYLDPCTTLENPTRAERFFTPEADGLTLSWALLPPQPGCIYVNPPYGRGIAPWIVRCGQPWGRPVVALVPARTDTLWWQQARPHAVCFWHGRLRFKGAPSSAPFPSAVLLWAPSNQDLWDFENVFWQHGQCWRPAS